jgi:hypothetical protein
MIGIAFRLSPFAPDRNYARAHGQCRGPDAGVLRGQVLHVVCQLCQCAARSGREDVVYGVRRKTQPWLAFRPLATLGLAAPGTLGDALAGLVFRSLLKLTDRHGDLAEFRLQARYAVVLPGSGRTQLGNGLALRRDLLVLGRDPLVTGFLVGFQFGDTLAERRRISPDASRPDRRPQISAPWRSPQAEGFRRPSSRGRASRGLELA